MKTYTSKDPSFSLLLLAAAGVRGVAYGAAGGQPRIRAPLGRASSGAYLLEEVEGEEELELRPLAELCLAQPAQMSLGRRQALDWSPRGLLVLVSRKAKDEERRGVMEAAASMERAELSLWRGDEASGLAFALRFGGSPDPLALLDLRSPRVELLEALSNYAALDRGGLSGERVFFPWGRVVMDFRRAKDGGDALAIYREAARGSIAPIEIRGEDIVPLPSVVGFKPTGFSAGARAGPLLPAEGGEDLFELSFDLRERLSYRSAEGELGKRRDRLASLRSMACAEEAAIERLEELGTYERRILEGRPMIARFVAAERAWKAKLQDILLLSPSDSVLIQAFPLAEGRVEILCALPSGGDAAFLEAYAPLRPELYRADGLLKDETGGALIVCYPGTVDRVYTLKPRYLNLALFPAMMRRVIESVDAALDALPRPEPALRGAPRAGGGRIYLAGLGGSGGEEGPAFARYELSDFVPASVLISRFFLSVNAAAFGAGPGLELLEALSPLSMARSASDSSLAEAERYAIDTAERARAARSRAERELREAEASEAAAGARLGEMKDYLARIEGEISLVEAEIARLRAARERAARYGRGPIG
jgi:hypothetical protein